MRYHTTITIKALINPETQTPKSNNPETSKYFNFSKLTPIQYITATDLQQCRHQSHDCDINLIARIHSKTLSAKPYNERHSIRNLMLTRINNNKTHW